MYQKSPIGKSKNIDDLPNLISTRNAEIRATDDAYGPKQSRQSSLTDIMFILDKVNKYPAISAISCHIVGMILNETDRLMYSMAPDFHQLYFYPKYAQSKFEDNEIRERPLPEHLAGSH